MTNQNNAAHATQKDWDAAVSAANLAPATGHVVLNAATVLNISALLSKLRAEGVPVAGDPLAVEEAFQAWADRFPEISDMSRLRDAWNAAPVASAPADERAAFERWYTRYDTPDMARRAVQRNSPAGPYRLMNARNSWEVWQARAALSATQTEQGERKYWLCCGSKDPNHPNRRAPDCFNADRAKWGTRSQHGTQPTKDGGNDGSL